MTPRCQLCGDFESENTTIPSGMDACWDCITSLIENEIERRGEREEQRRSEAYHSGAPTAEDRERQDLKDAGRGHLVR